MKSSLPLCSSRCSATRSSTPAGASVTLRCDEAAHAIIVEDTGIGIAPEDLPRVFDHGYTGLNGRRDKRATGLGLYLSKRVLDQLGQ